MEIVQWPCPLIDQVVFYKKVSFYGLFCGLQICPPPADLELATGLTDRQFQWTVNGHSQLPLAELGKPMDLLLTTSSNGRVNNFHCLTSTFDMTTHNPRQVKVDPHAKIKVKQENAQTNGCYQMYYRPCYAVDNYSILSKTACTSMATLSL